VKVSMVRETGTVAVGQDEKAWIVAPDLVTIHVVTCL